MREHNKLVRDRIPEIIAQSCTKANYRKLETDEEYIYELTRKLIEEAREVHEAPGADELGDLKEVVDTLVRALNISQKDIDHAQHRKALKNGRFEDRLFLISTE